MTNFELIKNMDIYQLAQFLNYLIDGSSADFDWDLEMNGYTYEDTMPDPPGDEIRIWLDMDEEQCPVVGLRSRILEVPYGQTSESDWNANLRRWSTVSGKK